MPDTFLGLLLFVVFLSPGLVFFFTREGRRPQRELSNLKETGAILLAGLVTNALLALLLLVARAIQKSGTPNIARFATDPAGYFKASPVFLVGWGIGLLAAGWLIAFGLALLPIAQRGAIRFASAWYQVFRGFPDQAYSCECLLEDGSWIGGDLWSFSTEVEETADRELVLRAPIHYRPPDGDEPEELENVSAVVVSARRILILEVARIQTTENGS